MTNASHRIRLSAKERFIAELIAKTLFDKPFADVMVHQTRIVRLVKIFSLLETSL